VSLVLSAVALTLAAPAQAVPAAPATAMIDPARKTRGIELARMLNSETTSRAQIDRMLNETFPVALAADPTFKSLEKNYPGISRAMIDAMRPIVTEQVMGTLPALWDSLGTIYAEELTAAELDEVLAFFRTPTGGRMIENIAREADFGAAMQEMLSGGQTEMTETSLGASLATGAVNTVRKLNDEDRKILTNFGWTAAGAKLSAAKKRVLPTLTAWSNQTDPAIDARMEKAMTGVVEKFMGKETPK
jgi:hypothetical protein